MEYFEKECTVVFELLVTEPAFEWTCGGGRGFYTPRPPLAGSVTINAKTTVLCSPDSSMVQNLPPKVNKFM
jgi:hypothetical protein